MRICIYIISLLFLEGGVFPAAASGTLTVYTYDGFTAEWGAGPQIKKTFEADCRCTLNFVSVVDGVALLNRVKLEGKATKADVVLGLDTNLTAEAADTGLFVPHGVDSAAFYSYAYPSPEGFGKAKVRPAAASFDAKLGEFLLPYDAVRKAPDPRSELMEFLRSTYEAAAELGRWDRGGLECATGEPGRPRPI